MPHRLVALIVALYGVSIVALAQDATPPARGTPEAAVLVGAGDIASCYDDNDEATARLLDGIPGTVVTLGDNAYDTGSAEDFAACYDPTWGRHLDRTRPVPGNHDYYTPGAAGYFGYFGDRAGNPATGWYSYDVGAWHVVALNSNCPEIGGCGPGSPELEWLAADLATHPVACTVALMHHPRFSSGGHDDDMDLGPMWQVLYDNDVDVVLSGHDHIYERFAPQNPWGVADPARGIVQFVVGTGGGPLRPLESVRANSVVASTDTFGVLKLTMRADGYDWEFVPAAGGVFTDTGSESCH